MYNGHVQFASDFQCFPKASCWHRLSGARFNVRHSWFMCLPYTGTWCICWAECRQGKIGRRYKTISVVLVYLCWVTCSTFIVSVSYCEVMIFSFVFQRLFGVFSLSYKKRIFVDLELCKPDNIQITQNWSRAWVLSKGDVIILIAMIKTTFNYSRFFKYDHHPWYVYFYLKVTKSFTSYYDTIINSTTSSLNQLQYKLKSLTFFPSKGATSFLWRALRTTFYKYIRFALTQQGEISSERDFLCHRRGKLSWSDNYPYFN